MALGHVRYVKGRRADQLGPQKPQAEPEALAPRWIVNYSCPKGHEFEVALAADAESPSTWDCPCHGLEAKPIGVEQPKKSPKLGRTYWDMLLERRTIPQLQALLTEEARRVWEVSEELVATGLRAGGTGR
ncbi:RNA polymerase-binding protein RbpA [Lentzea fradiae]|uniref:RNA polymerase-binding protein RbpA n=1 Tax=Lentzea fradiae TaxID=200378 RepID=UPI000B7C94AF|nr:RNA polymerase-binding protein RbpA [Lentzea fradiae]